MVASNKSGNTLLTSPPSLWNRTNNFQNYTLEFELKSWINQPFEVIHANFQIIYVQRDQFQLTQGFQTELILLFMVFIEKFDEITKCGECGTNIGVTVQLGISITLREFQCFHVQTFTQRTLFAWLMYDWG